MEKLTKEALLKVLEHSRDAIEKSQITLKIKTEVPGADELIYHMTKLYEKYDFDLQLLIEKMDEDEKHLVKFYNVMTVAAISSLMKSDPEYAEQHFINYMNEEDNIDFSKGFFKVYKEIVKDGLIEHEEYEKVVEMETKEKNNINKKPGA